MAATFGNIVSTNYACNYASNYTQNKRVRVIHKKCTYPTNLGRILPCSVLFNRANLAAGLFSEEDLLNVNVLSTVLGHSPTVVDSTLLPFYSNYTIDPSGQLFGTTTCGINNYYRFMKF